MSEKYNQTAERLWEKLANIRHVLNLDCVDFSKPFPFDQFAKANPIIKDFVREVQDEFDYELSEAQCSFAVNALIRWDMDEYNQRCGTALKACA